MSKDKTINSGCFALLSVTIVFAAIFYSLAKEFLWFKFLWQQVSR